VYDVYPVICQTVGEEWTETQSGHKSNVWNRIEWKGGIAYLHEGLMETPRTGVFPNAPLYECEN
jgi:hypothetical protein